MKKSNKKAASHRPRTPKGRYYETNNKGESTPEKIIKAARRVFATFPYNATTTRMIAKEAGVDHPLIHYYFGSKEQLFTTILEKMYHEFHRANLSWLEGLEGLPPSEGFSLYLDRLLDYNFENPQPMQLILLNMAQAGTPEGVPGFKYIILHLEREQKTLQDKFPIFGNLPEIKTFIHCFNNLVIALLGAKSCQAQVMGLEPDSHEYKKWIKDAITMLFLPALEKGTG